MLRVAVLVAVIGLGVYAFVSAMQADPDRIRTMPRWLWILVIVFAPVAGPLAWLMIGVPVSGQGPDYDPPVGPDDDPDFLRKL